MIHLKFQNFKRIMMLMNLSTKVMVVLTGGVDAVLEASSSGSRLECKRTSSMNSTGKLNKISAFSIMNETIWANEEAFVVKSSADICEKLENTEIAVCKRPTMNVKYLSWT